LLQLKILCISGGWVNSAVELKILDDITPNV
jgi:hypothetical protein